MYKGQGNGWGNTVSGSKTNEATGTSKHELRLGPGRAGVQQRVIGLHPGTPHTLAGWLRVSAPTESVRLGVLLPDGTAHWSPAVTTTAWTRVTVPFTTAAQGSVTVIIEKADGPGMAWGDNLGLPRAVP